MGMSPLQADRAKCIDCSAGSTKNIKCCAIYICSLWPFRFGMLPETAAKVYGEEFLDPEKMPDPNTPIDDLP